MPRHTALLLALATLSASAAVSLAQQAGPADPDSSQMNSPTTQSQPAPIQRAPVTASDESSYTKPLTTGEVIAPGHGTASGQAASGVFLRAGQNSSVNVVAASPENTELRVVHGVANISVHEPTAHAQILIDLPGGQTALIKDGFYTFNADTNTVRVLKGEAFTYPGSNQKSIKIKENHAVILGGPSAKSFEFDPFEARADLVPYSHAAGTSAGYGSAYNDESDYGDGGGYGSRGYGYNGFAYGGYPYGGFGFGNYYDYPFGYSPYGIYPFGFYGLGFYGGGYGGYGYGGYGGGYGYGGRNHPHPRGGFGGHPGVEGHSGGGSFHGGNGGGGSFHGGGGGVSHGGSGGGASHGGGGGGHR